MLARPKNQQAWHSLLAHNNKTSMAWKGRFDTRYTYIKTWLRECGGLQQYAALCAEYALQGGIPEGFSDGANQIHPRALMLIAKYGEEFTGLSWDAEGAEPKKGACFGNSRVQQLHYNNRMRSDGSSERMYYVEGIALGAWSNTVHHAWNALVCYPDVAFDWTWHATASWCFYFGIPLSQSEYNALRKLGYPDGKFHLLFKPESFPPMEEKLTEILEARRTNSNKRLEKQIIMPDRDF